MKSKQEIEETVAQIMALPEKEQVRQIVKTLDALPDEGRETVIAYIRITKEEPPEIA